MPLHDPACLIAPSGGSLRRSSGSWSLRHRPRRNQISISAEGIAREHPCALTGPYNSIRADHLSHVHNVVDRKSKKEYKVQTALVVAVDDSVASSKPDDVHALDDLANTTLLPLLTGSNFCLLALEGSVGLNLVDPIQ